MKPDARDGTMTGINGPMPPAQVKAYSRAPATWEHMSIGACNVAVLRALKDRGVVEGDCILNKVRPAI